MGRTSTQPARRLPGRAQLTAGALETAERARQSPAADALLPLIGLVRSVSTPEFAGVTFHEVTAKSVLNKVVAGSRMPFEWTINPYRGCSHACVYCFARKSHTYLDFDAGLDFDSQVVVKINAAEVLRRELAKPSWRHAARGPGHQHGPLPAGRGPLPADAGHHRCPGRFRHSPVDPDQGHAAGPGHPAAEACRGPGARRRGHLAGHDRRAASPKPWSPARPVRGRA